jgi:putative addiction module component (TIGR02574 family)
MPVSLEEVTKVAMDLPPQQKLALAELLLQTAELAADTDGEIAWEAELSDRIREIDAGRETGVSYEEVMRSAEARLRS